MKMHARCPADGRRPSMPRPPRGAESAPLRQFVGPPSSLLRRLVMTLAKAATLAAATPRARNGERDRRRPLRPEEGSGTVIAARPSGAAMPRYTEVWPREPESAHRARLLVSARLRAWGSVELADAGMLIVSELVANAVDHTPYRLIRVVVQRPALHLVRIGVADASRAVPELRCPGEGAERGRGLVLVDALSWRWGYDRWPWGKVVWAELRLGGGA
ncbi:ATP-binding protein [Streptomyces sp. NPDC056132]|uniref:ATP-binding protein n=1 Tax=Streptomyces sp. NPDC056132 TaxID=3345722 RepID=UPI0035D59154